MGEPLSNKKVAVFKKTEHSSKSDGIRNIDNILSVIRDHPNKEKILAARNSGKANKNKKYTIHSYGKDIKVNYYDFVKIRKVPAVTWALSLPKGAVKRKAEITDSHINGFIYYDIDNYNNCTLDELEYELRSLLSVYAQWRSFGGNGIGFIVHATNLNKENFLSTWEYYKIEIEKIITHNINARRGDDSLPAFFSLDSVTKDYTRLNILSYDPNIYICDEEKYVSLTAIDPIKRKNKRVISNTAIKNGVSNLEENEINDCHLEYVLNKWYSDGECFDLKDNRLTYYFYQRYFSECNILGIEYDEAFNFLIKSADKDTYNYLFSYRSEHEIDEIGKKQYNTYNNQFGTWIENYEGHPDATIIEYNKPFEGTSFEINDFLNYIYFNAKKNHIKINDFFIKDFTTKAKEAGLKRRHIIEFLLNKKFNQKQINVAIEIYNIPYIPFGLILEYSDDGKKKLRINKIIEAKADNKKVTEIFQPKNIDSNFLSTIDYDENVYIYMKTFFEKCNSYHIAKQSAIDYFINELDYKKHSYLIKTVANIIYSENEPYFGLFIEDKIIINEINNNSFYKEYDLKQNEYLSDLDLIFDSNTVVWSDTNSGKTTFICSDTGVKKIVLVPVIPLIKSIENRHKVAVFYGLKKNVNKNSDIIICTYTSFPRLFGKLNEWDILSDYELHIDEAHNFVTASSKGYRNKEMNFILDKMHHFNKVLLYSGTWINFLSPKLELFNIVRIRKTRKKIFKRILYKEKLPCVEQKCNKEKLNVIYLQSKKQEKELGKYKKYFIEKGWDESRMLFLNSNEKENPEFEYVINKETIKDKYNLVFCTSIAAEGLNVKDIKVHSLHFCTNESPHLLEQIINRFRDHVPENVYIYKKNDSVVLSPYNNLNMIEYQKKKAEAAKQLLSLINLKDNIEFFKTIQNTDFIRFIDSRYSIDYLSIAYSAYEHEKTYANNNIDYMINVLKEFGWKFDGDIIIEDTIEKEILKNLKRYRKAKGILLNTEQRKIFHEIKNNEDKDAVKSKTSDDALIQFQKNSALPDYELLIRKKLLYFARYMSWQNALDVIEYWVKDLKCSNSKLNTLVKQLLIIKQQKTGYFDQAVDINNKFFETIKIKYLDDKRLDNEPAYLEPQFVNTINKLGEKDPNFVKCNSFEEAKKLVDPFFEISTVLDKKGQIRYKLGAVKLVNEAAVHYKKCKAFATYHLKTNTTFTKSEVKDYILKIRKSLLYCGYYDLINEMHENDALEILKMYCDLKHKGRGIYEIVDMLPFIYNNIEWKFDSNYVKSKEESIIVNNK